MTSKTRVVICHGSYGSPLENWFPWLADEVGKLGLQAIVPRFPTPAGQHLTTWRTAFGEQVGLVTSDMVLVGHSLGAAFILSLLEEATVPVKGTVLVSGFLGSLGMEEFDSVNESFVRREFDWTRIRGHAGQVHVYNGDNDPYVPLSKGEELAARLGAPLTVIRGGGHINASAGFLSFPQLLRDVSPLLQS